MAQHPQHAIDQTEETEQAAVAWEPPSFVEINMSSEINGYQDDFGDVPDVSGSMPAHDGRGVQA
jgi:hypothetical protein